MLTSLGLAGAAGLNAFIPLLMLGLLARYTTLVTLPDGWQWLADDRMLVILAFLLAIEIIADKIPAVDSINDVIQTMIRPGAGGIVFASGFGATTVSSGEQLSTTNQWVMIASGVVIALGVHVLKAGARPALNMASAGFAAPLVSVIEDVISFAMAIFAILLPILAVLILLCIVGSGVFLVTKARKILRSRRAKTSSSAQVRA